MLCVCEGSEEGRRIFLLSHQILLLCLNLNQREIQLTTIVDGFKHDLFLFVSLPFTSLPQLTDRELKSW